MAREQAELDAFDLVDGLKIKDGPLVEVLNGVSLHGGLVGSWPREAALRAADIVDALVEHWREHDLPSYAQFDNGTVFHGPHIHPDVVGRVSRLCLSLGVVPVFASVSEHGFQAQIEGYNGLWQAKVWGRFQHESVEALADRSVAYVEAHRRRSAVRRPPNGGRSRMIGSSTCEPIRPRAQHLGWCSCGGPPRPGGCACSAAGSR